MPEEEVEEIFIKEGCPPESARIYVIAGRQLAQDQDGGQEARERGEKGIIPVFSTAQAEAIGDLLDVDWSKVDLEQFRQGLSVEMEHSDITGGDPLTTGKIVLAHLKEKRDYYDRLVGAGLESREEPERRTRTQGDGAYTLRLDDPRRKGARYPGTVAWWEHEEAWLGYRKRFPSSARDQDAEMIARRGGFSYNEMTEYLGHEPTTWQVSPQFASGGASERASKSPEECHVCQPFTQIVRDEERFKKCMALAEEIGEIGNSKAAYQLIKGDLGRQDQEAFVLVCVDFRGKLRDYALIGKGQRHRVAVDVEDVITPVLISKCDGFFVAHCHPSGVAEPSDADGELTKAIKKAAEAACPNVRFLDHLVIGGGTEGKDGSYYSFADNDWKVDGKVHKA